MRWLCLGAEDGLKKATLEECPYKVSRELPRLPPALKSLDAVISYRSQRARVFFLLKLGSVLSRRLVCSSKLDPGSAYHPLKRLGLLAQSQPG